MAIPVPCLKIHTRINTSRIAIQGSFDQALLRNELGPIVDTQEAKASDTVANGYLLRRLRLTFIENELLGSQSRIGQTMLEPTVNQGKVWILTMQMTC